MTIPGSANPLLLRSAAPTAYQVERSLRFNSSDSAYCVRTPASSTNRQKYTWSGWVKRSTLATKSHVLFTGYSNDFQYTLIAFNSSDQILINDYQSSADQINLVTTSVYRDPSAWYHIVLAVDTTIASPSSDRVKLYVNGAQVTTFSTATYPSQNLSTNINNNTTHYLGHFSIANATNNYFNGYLADVHLIDGQALDPTSFTEVSATTGQLIPKKYTGTFGTNGFWLQFADNSNNTATTLGKDTSGNGNNWTPTNFSVTAGAGNDSLVDTPTSYGTDTGAGGEVRGNYATLNPLDNGGLTLANGNLDASYTTTSWRSCRSTVGMSTGKWYFEATGGGTGTTDLIIGICKANASLSNYVGSDANGWGYHGNSGNKYTNGSFTSYGSGYQTAGDIVGIAFDADNGTLSFYKNGVSQGQAYSGLTSGPYFFAVGVYNNSYFYCNFGQRPFAYTAPSGFRPLVDTCLPAPAVAKASSAFDVKLYTGNGSTQTISGLGFSPDFVWLKARSTTFSHNLYDVIRGSNKALFSDTTDAETTYTDRLTAFNSDGFSLGAGAGVNQNTTTYAAWCWDAGTTTASNPDGSITSSVRANASAGFSIVTYTSQSSGNATIGHGLGVAPSLIINKPRNQNAGWTVYHASLGNAAYLVLNTTAAQVTGATTVWNSTNPTSTVFTQGSAFGGLGDMVAYCFAPVAGYSSFGSYTGNGSADGPFVFCGFRPRFLLVKVYSGDTGAWRIYDSSRNTYNVVDLELNPNSSGAEYTASNTVDFTSNGFKIRTSNINVNLNTAGFIYAAFAESPFQYARAR